MTREDHLKFCSVCFKRKMDAHVGLVCELTNQMADFKDECEFFELDEKEQQLRYEQRLHAAGDGATGDSKDFRANKDLGAALFVIGIAVTIGSHAASASTGFTIVAYGTIVAGVLQYLRGREQEQVHKDYEAHKKAKKTDEDPPKT